MQDLSYIFGYYPFYLITKLTWYNELTRANTMSVSNPAEAELRELVAKTLEEKGVLGKVKVTELSLIGTRKWSNMPVAVKKFFVVLYRRN